jgi:hypothetical protein
MMDRFSDADLSLLSALGEFLVLLGLAGAVSLFFFSEGRRVLERSLGMLFILLAVGGGALAWKVDILRGSNRDLTPAEQIALSKAISHLPAVKFEVVTSSSDREAHALALKIVNAIKEGSGAMPLFDDKALSTPMGVVLVFAVEDENLRHNVADTVGRLLMRARIAVISDRATGLPKQTVRIVVGGRP